MRRIQQTSAKIMKITSLLYENIAHIINSIPLQEKELQCLLAICDIAGETCAENRSAHYRNVEKALVVVISILSNELVLKRLVSRVTQPDIKDSGRCCLPKYLSESDVVNYWIKRGKVKVIFSGKESEQ